jgi:DNA-binding transcriptional ArsR family regulator
MLDRYITHYPHMTALYYYSQEDVFAIPNTYIGEIMDKHSLSNEVTLLHAEICSALADPIRILILYALSEQELNVSELADYIGVPQPTASRHLKVLRERGLVRPSRQGASMMYRLTDHRLIEALDLLRAVLHARIQYRATLLETPE